MVDSIKESALMREELYAFYRITRSKERKGARGSDSPVRGSSRPA